MAETSNTNENKQTIPPEVGSISDLVGQEKLREMIKSAVTKMGPEVSKEEKKEYAKLYIKIFEKGMSPKEAMKFSEPEMSMIYSYAYYLFNGGKYAEACELFKMLFILDPTEPGLATALGVCHHRMKAYELALICYMMAAQIDIFDPVPLFYAYDCYMNTNDPESAIFCLYNVMGRAQHDDRYSKLYDKASAIIEAKNKQDEEQKQTTT